MATWSEFAADEPQLAGAIRALIQQYGPGLGYLATVRADGGPRVHPVSPVITDEGLFCFIIDSPKRRDLERDGRYALHSFPPEETDDEAYVAGRAHPVTDPARVARLARDQRAAPEVDWRLFEFTIDVAMLTRHGRSGASPMAADQPDGPAVQVWLDPTTTVPAANEIDSRSPGARHPTGALPALAVATPDGAVPVIGPAGAGGPTGPAHPGNRRRRRHRAAA